MVQTPLSVKGSWEEVFKAVLSVYDIDPGSYAAFATTSAEFAEQDEKWTRTLFDAGSLYALRKGITADVARIARGDFSAYALVRVSYDGGDVLCVVYGNDPER